MGTNSQYYPNNNPDGWGLLTYDDSITEVGRVWRGEDPANNDSDFSAAILEMQQDPPRIVLGHVRNASVITGIEDPHPFVFSWGNRDYSFIHNGFVDSYSIVTMINTLDGDWLDSYPLVDYSSPGSPNPIYLDSEAYFSWIMLNISLHDGNIVQGLKDAVSAVYSHGLSNPNYSNLNFVLSDGMDLYAYRYTDDELHPLLYFQSTLSPAANKRYSGVMTIFPDGVNFIHPSYPSIHEIDLNELVYISSTGNVVRLPDFGVDIGDNQAADLYSLKLSYHEGINWAGLPIMVNNGTGNISILNSFTQNNMGGLHTVYYGDGDNEYTEWIPNYWTNDTVPLTQRKLYKLEFDYDSPTMHTYTGSFGGYVMEDAALIDPNATVQWGVTAYQPYWLSYTLLPSQNIVDAFGEAWSDVFSVRAEDWFYRIPPENPRNDFSVGTDPYTHSTAGKNMDFGKGYIVTFKNNQLAFSWNRSYAPHNITLGIAKAEFFEWEDKPDYMVIDVLEIANSEDVEEIGVFQGDTCIGGVKADIIPCQILTYPDVDDPTPITFEILPKSKALPLHESVYQILNKNDNTYSMGSIIAQTDGWYQVKLLGDTSMDNIESPSMLTAVTSFPNPFNPDTSISFSLSEKAEVSIMVYNAKGQKVRGFPTYLYNSGKNIVSWNGKDNQGNTVSSGIYFMRLSTKHDTYTHKMLLMK